MNQPTGRYDGWWILSSLTSELMYAGYDKFNDTLGGKLPLTNSEKLNQDIYLDAMDKGEPPRDCRRLNAPREYDNENTKLYPRNERASRPYARKLKTTTHPHGQPSKP